MVIPALLIVAPLWLRNVLLYGAWDFLGLQFHDAVVRCADTRSLEVEEHDWPVKFQVWHATPLRRAAPHGDGSSRHRNRKPRLRDKSTGHVSHR